jgi:hypothetical protein
MSQAGFKPAIPASDQSQTHALDRVTTGIVCYCYYYYYYYYYYY